MFGLSCGHFAKSDAVAAASAAFFLCPALTMETFCLAPVPLMGTMNPVDDDEEYRVAAFEAGFERKSTRPSGERMALPRPLWFALPGVDLPDALPFSEPPLPLAGTEPLLAPNSEGPADPPLPPGGADPPLDPDIPRAFGSVLLRLYEESNVVLNPKPSEVDGP